MAEQARRSIISLNESIASGSLDINDLSFADDALLNDTVFEDKAEMSSGFDVSTLDITDSVSEQVEMVEEDSNAEVNEALAKAYNTSNKRFERAIGNRIVNNDIIKLKPVSICLLYTSDAADE